MADITKIVRRLVVYLTSVPELKYTQCCKYIGQYPFYPLQGNSMFATPMYRFFRADGDTLYDLYATSLPKDVDPEKVRKDKDGLEATAVYGGWCFAHENKVLLRWFPLPFSLEYANATQIATEVFLHHIQCKNKPIPNGFSVKCEESKCNSALFLNSN